MISFRGEPFFITIILAFAFAISFFTVPFVIWFANKSGAVSMPGGRHIHVRPTPKFGGISIALGALFALLVFAPLDRVLIAYIISSALMLSLGIIDDLKESNWKVKFIISSVAISILIFGGDIWIRNLGNLFGLGPIHLGLWGIPFTYFAIFGVINAINLIDGLNGLACGVSVIGFAFFAIFAYGDNNVAFYISLANLASALGLFRYNYPRARLFMGDSGSLFIGFSLAAVSVLLTQGRASVNPMVPVLVLCLPIFDTVRVMVVRILNRRHPFHADKTHIHHLMARSRIRPDKVVKIIWLLAGLMSSVAYIFRRSEPWVLLVIFLCATVTLSIFVEKLDIIRLRRSRTVPDRQTLLARLSVILNTKF